MSSETLPGTSANLLNATNAISVTFQD